MEIEVSDLLAPDAQVHAETNQAIAKRAEQGALAKWVVEKVATEPSWTKAWKEFHDCKAGIGLNHISRPVFRAEYAKHHPNPKRGPARKSG